MEDPVKLPVLYYGGGKPPSMCPREWDQHSCFLAPDHRGRHLCACGERLARD